MPTSSRLETLSNFYSPTLNCSRNIYVYLPSGYDEHAELSYPTLYIHAGQRVFPMLQNRPSWHLDETLDRLIGEGTIEPVIVVAIEILKWDFRRGPKAEIDYFHPLPSVQKHFSHFVANAPRYEQFILKELVPYIDENYRTRQQAKERLIVGASAGAITSFHTAMEQPETFGNLAMMSPSVELSVGNRLFGIPIPFWNTWVKMHKDFSEKKPIDIWIDVGTAEKSLPQEKVNAFVDTLKTLGFSESKDLCYYVDKGGQHNEKTWGKRSELLLRHYYTVKQ